MGFYFTNMFFWCVIWVYLKSVNGSPECGCRCCSETVTADSGKPHIVYTARKDA